MAKTTKRKVSSAATPKRAAKTQPAARSGDQPMEGTKMATATKELESNGSASNGSENVDLVQQIGETAGSVWKVLNENGALSQAKLIERVGGNRDLVLQAIGWLAREDKLDISETKRGRTIGLRA